MEYILVAIVVIFVFVMLPLEASIVIVAVLAVQTLVTMAAAYFVVGRVSFLEALKAVLLSALLTFIAAVLVLPALGSIGGLAIPLTLVVTFAAAAWGVSIALKSTFWQGAIISVLILGISLISEKIFNLGFGPNVGV